MKYGYLAFSGFENELSSEILFKTKRQATQLGRLFLFDEPLTLAWSQLTFDHLKTHDFTSIKDAAHHLRSLKKTWAFYSFQLHRRSQLIQDSISKLKPKKLEFLEALKPQDFGFWCLLEDKKLLYSESTKSPLPLGEILFHENPTEPPSRAYLKLWEVFTLHLEPPRINEIVVDLGACPGGWTWVLKDLAEQVHSVDKAPLDPKIMKAKNVKFWKQDAFKWDPKSLSKVDWLFSDIICEPAKLYDLVQKWLDHHPEMKCVCTLKFKGKTDFKTTDQFARIPESKVVHLHHNKHEVTWIKGPFPLTNLR